MVALGHPDVGFAHGTAASLYNGSILWHGRDKPSNLSFFTLDILRGGTNWYREYQTVLGTFIRHG
jgi:hypothetical protein